MKVAIFASGTGSNFEVLADDDALKKSGHGDYEFSV